MGGGGYRKRWWRGLSEEVRLATLTKELREIFPFHNRMQYPASKEKGSGRA